jgi:hypothetical protein
MVVAASFAGDTLVLTLVDAVTLTIVVHIAAVEWGRRAS